MGYNIEWASPEKTKAYSFEGRLYQSKRTAMVQWTQRTETRKKGIQRVLDEGGNPEDCWWLKKPIPPVYEIAWTWRELDDGEYT